MRRTGLVLGLLVALVMMPTRLMAQSLDELTQQAITAQDSGKSQEAEAIWRKILQNDPNNAYAHHKLCDVLDDQNKMAEAESACRSSVRIDPNDVKYQFLLGYVLKKQGKLEELEEQKKLNEQEQEIINIMISGQQLDSYTPRRPNKTMTMTIPNYQGEEKINISTVEDYSYVKNYSYTPRQPNNKETFVDLLNSYTPQRPNNRKIILNYPGENPTFYINLGNDLIDPKKQEEAIKAYRKAIELDPKNATAYNNLGLALIQQGELKEAITAYRKAIEFDPEYAEAYNNLSIALKEEGKLEEAILQLHEAISLDPQSSIFNGSLGDVLKEQNKLEEAISQYRKALSLNDSEVSENLPNGTFIPQTTAHTVAHNNLGLIYQQQGKLKEALAEYEAALKIDPKFEYAKSNRDAVLALLKQPTELAYTDTNYLRLDDPLTRPKRAVVFLTALFPQGRDKDKKGTGFIIKRTSNKLWIITNRHILLENSNGRTCDSVEIQLYVGDKPSNARIKTLQSKTILTAEKIDLALIEIEVPNLPDDIQPLSPAIPQDNQKISTIGHPDGNPWQSDQGKVADVSDKELLLKISFAVGSSGSPVMDENYGVVGIITNVGDRTGYAIPISQITKQIAIWGIKLP